MSFRHCSRTGFILCVAAAILFSAFLGALAVVPHAHGHDLDHSSHKSCPVHQKGLHSSDAVFLTAALWTSISLFRLPAETLSSFELSEAVALHLSRAPPALLF